MFDNFSGKGAIIGLGNRLGSQQYDAYYFEKRLQENADAMSNRNNGYQIRLEEDNKKDELDSNEKLLLLIEE